MKVQLSDRLQMIANLVPKKVHLLDIGSDHAYLPIALIKEKKIDFAVAGEVVKGPYESALSNVYHHRLQSHIAVRLADGFDALGSSDEVDCVTICGMGGRLIVEILEKGKEKLVNVDCLILQPNNCEDDVRAWLSANHFMICIETIVQDKGKFYEIIKAQKGTMHLSERQLRFGPYLLQEHSAIFYEKWRLECTKLEKALNRVPLDKSKERQQLVKRIKMIKEVLE
ncbi:tRNA (adenine(22)-N(1))-methyltransferase [Streptococcus sciuri]|uniref:tRNA (Adenine(22)-N(1))-methyltransferase TrmK n=1 Tax=Streptococcus sciuri TaxID=2973939 RepID=A0ABT2F4N9_9STRE|nr:tRNA (adenine(22)-N(1))-methyltransferase TrmK [Streptococcus sciuri]MCS4487394.1 tRNA (adenine(22)-N(1))-methyltransferase TrmK [Streptococcus sciuri]